MRSAGSLPHLLPALAQLRTEGIPVIPVFLDASTDALVRRFSETRRPHPLSDQTAFQVSGLGTAEISGDGRRALIDAGVALAREGGPDAVTLTIVRDGDVVEILFSR